MKKGGATASPFFYFKNVKNGRSKKDLIKNKETDSRKLKPGESDYYNFHKSQMNRG